jgi:hyperosmotically inducible periplasmic protein
LIMRFLSLVLLFSLVLTPLVAQKKTVSDDVINDQVRVKLASDSEIGGMSIQVDVQNGVVTLKGKVRNDKMRSKAEKVAKKVKGVSSVTNQIVVSPD